MSDLWHIIYSDAVPPEQTARECDFFERFLPLETHPRLLDLACESGRHSLLLAERGYDVTGVDIDPRALLVAHEKAKGLGVEVEFINADLHDLRTIAGPFDGVILLWQSFGFFSSEAQSGLFTQIRRLLRVDGILILDLFNRLYYTRGAVTALPFASGVVRPAPWSETERITEMLGYEEEKRFEQRRMVDLLDPHLFSLGEVAGIAHNYGLHLILTSSDYSPDQPSTPDFPKMQLMFRRT